MILRYWVPGVFGAHFNHLIGYLGVFCITTTRAGERGAVRPFRKRMTGYHI